VVGGALAVMVVVAMVVVVVVVGGIVLAGAGFLGIAAMVDLCFNFRGWVLVRIWRR
jgi:hypothetical protein